MNTKEIIRQVQAIKISGTDCPKLPKSNSTHSKTENRYSDPASASGIENYPIPTFFKFRTISAERCRV